MTAAPSSLPAPEIGPEIGIERPLRLVRGVTAAFLVVLALAALAPIRGAVVAAGQVAVPGEPRPVQSLEAGVVAGLEVAEGAQVAAGQILMRLDPTLAQTRLDIATDRLAQTLAESAALSAELANRPAPDFTPPPLPFPAPDLTRAAPRAEALFAARARLRAEAEVRAAEGLGQIRVQLDGLTAQEAQLAEEIALVAGDLARQADLVAQGLARKAPLVDLQRQASALDGRKAGLAAERARLEGALREAAATRAEAESRRIADVTEALRDAEARAQELTAEIVALRATLDRTALRAPVAGIVHELAVATPGAVVAAGAVLARVVPTGTALEIEVSVDPRRIDSLHEGQRADVMLTSFDPQGMPKLPASVRRIAPGAARDDTTGASFYRVTLALDPGALPAGVVLRPGMPVQAFLATGQRSLAAWLLDPLTRPLERALREE
jgi:HlyD family secretion protein